MWRAWCCAELVSPGGFDEGIEQPAHARIDVYEILGVPLYADQEMLAHQRAFDAFDQAVGEVATGQAPGANRAIPWWCMLFTAMVSVPSSCRSHDSGAMRTSWASSSRRRPATGK